MSVILQAVLAPEDLAKVGAELEAATWGTGKRTAGSAARQVKENLQADGQSPRIRGLEQFVVDALRRHPLFEIAARPVALTRLMFSRYEPGMTYGDHTDDAFMGSGGDKLRTDLAFTVFLAPLETYEGGALVIETALGSHEVRLEAGDAILYPAGSIHRVAPVTRGARLAAVGWVQSAVADAGRREILFDLSVSRARLAEGGAQRADLLLLDKSISNLLRMWGQV